jgi:AGZA family xanthine/uracil permease-like MFS transporter
VTATTDAFRPKLWVAGDLNAFFGLGTNVLLNVLVLAGLALGVVQLPTDTVFGRILPALGIALPLGNLFYAYLAYRLAKQTGRSDVAAMPYGPSVPHMFIVIFVIALPVFLKTNDPIQAWQAGLAWAFIIGIIVLLGAFVGPYIRKFTPRAAMLGTLAGISITFISMRPAFQMWDPIPFVAFASFAIILISWTANVRLPFGIPGGLAAIVAGSVLYWVAVATGQTTNSLAPVSEAANQIGLRIPVPSTDVFTGLSNIGPLLATAIPLGIYNFTEGMNNVESASAAGDSYNLRHILLADGIGAVVGSIFGSPFPPAVYIGHPGWKAVGGRIGYSLATGIFVGLICFLGLAALLLAIIPIAALVPILLFIGLVIGAQAFSASPARHYPAAVLAILPNLALWAKGLVDNTLAVAGTDVNTVGLGNLANAGVLYQGMSLFAGGAVLAGLVLGAIAVFVIDRQFTRAIAASLIAAGLSFIGLINGSDQVGINASPTVTVGYLFMTGVFVIAAFNAGQLNAKGVREVAVPLEEAA